MRLPSCASASRGGRTPAKACVVGVSVRGRAEAGKGGEAFLPPLRRLRRPEGQPGAARRATGPRRAGAGIATAPHRHASAGSSSSATATNAEEGGSVASQRRTSWRTAARSPTPAHTSPRAASRSAGGTTERSTSTRGDRGVRNERNPGPGLPVPAGVWRVCPRAARWKPPIATRHMPRARREPGGGGAVEDRATELHPSQSPRKKPSKTVRLAAHSPRARRLARSGPVDRPQERERPARLGPPPSTVCRRRA